MLFSNADGDLTIHGRPVSDAGVVKLVELIKDDAHNQARFAVAIVALVRCAVHSDFLSRQDLFEAIAEDGFGSRMVVPSKEFTSVRTGVGTQNGILRALQTAKLIDRMGTGTRPKFTQRGNVTAEAVLNALEGDGRILKKALWPSDYPDNAPPDPPAPPPVPTSLERPAIRAPGGDIMMNLDTIERYAKTLPMIAATCEKVDKNNQSLATVLRKFADAVDANSDQFSMMRQAFDAFRETTQSARDTTVRSARETHDLVAMMEKSLAAAADAVPTALLIEQLKVSRARSKEAYNHLLGAADSEDRLLKLADALLSKHGGNGG
jgi:hypothetical protein